MISHHLHAVLARERSNTLGKQTRPIRPAGLVTMRAL
jgi:hypothetical protein